MAGGLLLQTSNPGKAGSEMKDKIEKTKYKVVDVEEGKEVAINLTLSEARQHIKQVEVRIGLRVVPMDYSIEKLIRIRK